jgi:anion-transporting  ArsA/GET3 family ATPase
VLDHRLLIVSGKGGVGKSAVAASLALQAGRRGASALAISLTDPLGLATHLGVRRLGYDARPVSPGVAVAAVDRSRALDEYLRLQLRIPRAAPIGQFSRIFQVLIDTAPGVREIVSMGKPIFEVWKEDWDIIIVDAPPLGQLQSYLGAPATIADLVPSGAVKEQAARMRDTLADQSTSGLVLVSTPEELPAIETTEMLDVLADEPIIDIAGVVTNRVITQMTVDDDVFDALPAGPIRAAAHLHQTLAADQQRWLEVLPRGPQLAYHFGVLTAPELAATLTDAWDDL